MHAHIAAVLAVATLLVAPPIVAETSRQAKLVGPVISSVSPSAPSRSASAQTLTIAGSNFSPGLSVEVVGPDSRAMRFAGSAIQTRRETSFQLAVTLIVAGTYTLTVTNADGAASEPFVFKAQSSAVKPAIDRVLPEQLSKGPEPKELSILGERFMPGLVVYLTDPIGTVYLVKGPAIGPVTATSFEASVVLAMAGEYALMVTNPSGESSDTVTLSVSHEARRR